MKRFMRRNLLCLTLQKHHLRNVTIMQFIKNNVAMISNNDVVPFSHEAEADRKVQKEISVVLREVNA